MHKTNKFRSAVFLTFSGNCKEALVYYQGCFGGTLQFEVFEKQLQSYTEMPVVGASLVADNIVIHGSDLVHAEGRILGNYMAISLQCTNTSVRKELIEKLGGSKTKNHDEKLIEIIDPFDVRWVLHI